MTDSLNLAYQHCRQLARQHYENFPVASWLLPKALRDPISVIYAFARTADDFADEGGLDTDARLAKLDEYASNLDALIAGTKVSDPVFIALGDVMTRHHLPRQLFYDLLTAFRQDVTKKRYADFREVLDYCRHSANPLGRLLLYLFNAATPDNLRQSDTICTALQLVNFLQDMEQDYVENGRIYLPQDEMAQYGVDDAHIENRISDDAMRKLIQMQIKRTRELMLSGRPLGRVLPGRAGLELRATIYGGLRVLDRLEQHQNVFSRPRLQSKDWLWIAWKSLAL